VSLASGGGFSSPGLLSYRAAIFRSRYENLIDFDPGPPPRLVNTSNIGVNGCDFAVQANASKKMALRASVTGLDFELPIETSALRSRLRLRASANATYAAAPELTASFQASLVGSVFDSSVPTGSMYLSPYLAVDAFVPYSGRYGRVTLALDNVLDREYGAIHWLYGSRAACSRLTGCGAGQACLACAAHRIRRSHRRHLSAISVLVFATAPDRPRGNAARLASI
jgi:outer membrane cobalamin receptor